MKYKHQIRWVPCHSWHHSNMVLAAIQKFYTPTPERMAELLKQQAEEKARLEQLEVENLCCHS